MSRRTVGGMTRFSRSAIDRLGKRLRESDVQSDDDVAMYVAWSVGYTAAMHEVQAAVAQCAAAAGIQGPVSARIKQIDSMVAKLRRMPTRLSGLEDVAGCRIVVPSTRHADRLAAQCATLQISRVRNYQAEPHNGYRARHMTIRASDGRPVELQIRTEIGDLWANLTERCAALIDPDLKYGGGPQPFRDFLDELPVLGHVLDTAWAGFEAARHRLQSDTLLEEEASIDRAQPGGIDKVLRGAEAVLHRATDGFRQTCHDFPGHLEDAR